MKYEVLTNYFGQNVEVSVRNKTFTGTLRQAEMDDGSNDIIELEPIDEYLRKRYGSAIIESEAITSIRAIKNYDEDDDEDCCKDSGS